jgi:hypothetical protein
VIVIYAVEGPPADQQRTLNHLTALEQAGHQFVRTLGSKNYRNSPHTPRRWITVFRPLLPPRKDIVVVRLGSAERQGLMSRFERAHLVCTLI